MTATGGLTAMYERYGTVQNYLTDGLGVSKETVVELREKMLQ